MRRLEPDPLDTITVVVSMTLMGLLVFALVVANVWKILTSGV